MLLSIRKNNTYRCVRHDTLLFVSLNVLIQVRAGVDRLSSELSDWAARDAGGALRLTQPPAPPRASAHTPLPAGFPAGGGLAELSVAIGALEQHLAGLHASTSAEKAEREVLIGRLAEVRPRFVDCFWYWYCCCTNYYSCCYYCNSNCCYCHHYYY